MSGSAGLSPSRNRKPEGSTLSECAWNLRKECAGLVAGQAVLTAEIRTAGRFSDLSEVVPQYSSVHPGSFQRNSILLASNQAQNKMAQFRRVLLTVPFAIQAVLTLLMLNADRFHLRGQHIAGYCFLFGTPWAWLLDR